MYLGVFSPVVSFFHQVSLWHERWNKSLGDSCRAAYVPGRGRERASQIGLPPPINPCTWPWPLGLSLEKENGERGATNTTTDRQAIAFGYWGLTLLKMLKRNPFACCRCPRWDPCSKCRRLQARPKGRVFHNKKKWQKGICSHKNTAICIWNCRKIPTAAAAAATAAGAAAIAGKVLNAKQGHRQDPSPIPVPIQGPSDTSVHLSWAERSSRQLNMYEIDDVVAFLLVSCHWSNCSISSSNIKSIGRCFSMRRNSNWEMGTVRVSEPRSRVRAGSKVWLYVGST